MNNKLPYIIRLSLAGIVLILSILAVLGIFYPINFLNIEFSALLQRLLFDFSAIAIALFLALIILTLIFGRLYCSVLCPLGILQEFISLLLYEKNNSTTKNYIFKYIISGITVGALIGGSVLLIRYIDPYTLFGSAVSLTIYGIISVLLILTIVFFKNRLFCTNICPVGAILGCLSKFSANKIYMTEDCISCGICERNCPAGCIDACENKIDNEMCLKCFKCISVCPNNAIKYGMKPKQKVKFSIKRREVIGSIAFLSALGAGLAIGINLTKGAIKMVKGIIIPPGSSNTQRMTNKCLNCNLCIDNCPNKILVKADDNYNAVHIDYEKGKGYCDYNCNKCSEVCPSGAIRKISRDEKQKIRIAMAVINDNCTGCKNCIEKCPKNAITFENNLAKIDSTKCIGCGKCKIHCYHKAIEIFAVNEQSVI